MDKRKAAEAVALKAARKKGPQALEKVGVVSLREDLKQHRKEYEKLEKTEEMVQKQKTKDQELLLKKEELQQIKMLQKEPERASQPQVAVDLEFYEDDLWGDIDLLDVEGPGPDRLQQEAVPADSEAIDSWQLASELNELTSTEEEEMNVHRDKKDKKGSKKEKKHKKGKDKKKSKKRKG